MLKPRVRLSAPHDLRPDLGMRYPRLHNPGAGNQLRFTHELENAEESESIIVYAAVVVAELYYTGSHDGGDDNTIGLIERK